METQVLNVDSRLRDMIKYPNSADFIMDFNTPIKNLSSISLSSIEFPVVSYVFSDQRKNNFFRFNGSVINITDGNYTLRTLMYVIGLQLVALDSEFNFGYSETTGKITMASEIPFTVDFSADTPYHTLGRMMGFLKPSYGPVVSLNGESTISFSGDNYFFLQVNDYGRVGMHLNEDPVFCKIVTCVDRFGILYNNRSDFICKTHEFRQPVNLHRFHIRVLDYLGKPLDNVSMDFSLTFEVSVIYKASLKNALEKKIF